MATLAMREMIEPADLPPFGSLIMTNTGHIGEVVAWFGPDKNPAGSCANKRVVFALVFDDPKANSGMRPSVFAEDMILRHEPQTLPRFSRWLIGLIVGGSAFNPDAVTAVPTTSTKFN